MSSHPETRSITIAVSEKVFTGLVESGRKRGYTPSLFAKLLFEAGYAASVGKGAGDPVLADCVEKSLARRAPIAMQPKVTVAAEPLRPVVVREAVAVAVPVPVLVPVPIAVPLPVRTEPAATHLSVELLAAAIATNAATITPEDPAVVAEPEPEPQDVARPRPAPKAMLRSIRSLSAAGNSAREIARTLGCRETYVRDVLAGRAA